MSTWFEGRGEIDCGLERVARCLEDLGAHHLGVIGRMPGLSTVEVVEQGLDFVTLRTNEGAMKRTAISKRIEPDRVVGRIPKGMTSGADPQKRILLANLPRLLRGYGKCMEHVDAAIVVVVDADRRDCAAFKDELLSLLSGCAPRPETLFRIAVEEMDAWLLGDPDAVLSAYPRAKLQILNSYDQDSICGGAAALKRQGWPAPGVAKCSWAERIAPLVNVDANQSKSFQVFRDGLRRLAGTFSSAPGTGC